MKTFVRNFAVLSLIFVLSHLSLLAEGPAPLGDSSQLPFYSIENKIGVRIGAGFATSYLDLESKDWGYISYPGDSALVLRDKLESPANIAISAGAKYGLKDWFAVGINLDYNCLKLNNVRFTTGPGSSSGTVLDSDGDDFGYFHLMSVFGFVELRLPLPNFGPGFVLGTMSPYVQAGIGGTYIMQDMSSRIGGGTRDGEDILDLDSEILFGFMLAAGIECFIENNPDLSLFIEARWHRTLEGNYTLKPLANSRFDGDLDVSNLSWYMGVNLYFGGTAKS